MKLNSKTRNDLTEILKIEKNLGHTYQELLKLNNVITNINKLLKMVEEEQNYLKMIDLNETILENIKKYIEGKTGLNLNQNLILSSLSVSMQKYPYLRAYARIYYEYNRRKLFTDFNYKTLYIDQEVLNLYRALYNFRKEAELDIKDVDSTKLQIILLNSPLAEIEVIRNIFSPPEVCDLIEFASELYTCGITSSKSVMLDKIKEAILSRKKEFDSLFNELLYTLLVNIELYNKGDSWYRMVYSYFKTIFLLLDEESRQVVYGKIEDIISYDNDRFNKYGFLEGLLGNIEEDLEKNYIPHIKHFSLLPY